jgi:hypothetical protein
MEATRSVVVRKRGNAGGAKGHGLLREAVKKRLREELSKLEVEVNEEKSRKVDLTQRESLGSLGLSCVGSVIVGDDGCRYERRKAKSGRACYANSRRFSESIAQNLCGDISQRLIPSCGDG